MRSRHLGLLALGGLLGLTHSAALSSTARAATVPATNQATFQQIGLQSLALAYSASGGGTFEGTDYTLSAAPTGSTYAVSVPFSLKVPATGAVDVTLSPVSSALVPFTVHQLDALDNLALLAGASTKLLNSQFSGPGHDVKLGAFETTEQFLYRFDFHGFEVRQNGAGLLTPWASQPFGIDFPIVQDVSVPVEVSMYVDIWLTDIPGYGLTSPILLNSGGLLTGSSSLAGTIAVPVPDSEPSLVTPAPGPPGPERFLIPFPFSNLKLGPLSLAGSFSMPVEIASGDSPADLTFEGTANWQLQLDGTGANAADWSAAFVVPEPSAFLLMTLSLATACLVALRRRTSDSDEWCDCGDQHRAQDECRQK